MSENDSSAPHEPEQAEVPEKTPGSQSQQTMQEQLKEQIDHALKARLETGLFRRKRLCYLLGHE